MEMNRDWMDRAERNKILKEQILLAFECAKTANVEDLFVSLLEMMLLVEEENKILCQCGGCK